MAAQTATTQGVAGTFIFKEDWSATLQRTLDNWSVWKEISDVRYLDRLTLHNPYLSDPAVATLSPGTPYSFQLLSRTDETLDLTTHQIATNLIDRATLGQSGYDDQMGIARRQAYKLDQAIETNVLGNHANMTDFGSENLSGSSGSTQITVSLTNIDDIITNVVRTIHANSGSQLAKERGVFIVWGPTQFQLLQTFAMSTGFSLADAALRNGIDQGFRYMGVDHYVSNNNASNHLVGGVKGTQTVGVYTGTYGQIVVTQEPNQYSGVSVTTRVDYGYKVWTGTKAALFDINIA